MIFDKHLINVAHKNLGATCSAPAHSNNFLCTAALDNIINTDGTTDWASNCSNMNCKDLVYLLNLNYHIEPVRVCLAGRFTFITFSIFININVIMFFRYVRSQSMIKKIKVIWSSGHEDYYHFPSHKYRVCFDYRGKAIEKSASFLFQEFYGNPLHVGLAIINIYGIGKLASLSFIYFFQIIKINIFINSSTR